MSDFDLISPLNSRAKEIEKLEKSARETALAQYKATAAETLRLRAERNKPFVKRHNQFAASYVASEKLLTAVNVALSLGRPLRLPGGRGSGKTLAAHWLAHVLNLGSVEVFNVKSESRAQDLLYSFDAVSWFRESQAAAMTGSGKVEKSKHLEPGPLGLAFGWRGPPERVSVVLIDEIDKAPRDFPNDLLNELDQMRFTVAEDNNRLVSCEPDKRPIVVITSNQERRLPDPFLRRCVSHEIKLTVEIVTEILHSRLEGIRAPAAQQSETSVKAEARVIAAAIPVWSKIKEKPELSRAYTVDEFWRWLAIAMLDLDDAKIVKLAEALEKKALDDPLLRTSTILSDDDMKTVQGRLTKG